MLQQDRIRAEQTEDRPRVNPVIHGLFCEEKLDLCTSVSIRRLNEIGEGGVVAEHRCTRCAQRWPLKPCTDSFDGISKALHGLFDSAETRLSQFGVGTLQSRTRQRELRRALDLGGRCVRWQLEYEKGVLGVHG
jgi:hypothetical protein